MKWFEINSKDLFDPIYNPTSRIDFLFVRRMKIQIKWDKRKRNIGNNANRGNFVILGDDVAL